MKLPKFDKKAFGIAVGFMVMSWIALPIVYYLLVKKHKQEKEVKKDVKNVGQKNHNSALFIKFGNLSVIIGKDRCDYRRAVVC